MTLATTMIPVLCKVKVLLPLFIDIAREALLCNKVNDSIHSNIHRVYISPSDVSILTRSSTVAAAGSQNNVCVDSRSHFLVLYSDSTCSVVIAVCQFVIEPKLLERDVRQTSNSNNDSSTTNSNITIHFFKEEIDLLKLDIDKQNSFHALFVPKYRFSSIDTIYLSNIIDDKNDYQSEFDYQWARVGLKVGSTLNNNGGVVNLFQRLGKINKYQYKLLLSDNNSSNTISDQSSSVIKEYSIITNQTKIIYNNSNNNNSNSMKDLNIFDKQTYNRIKSIISIYFNISSNSSNSNNNSNIIYNKLNISKPQSLLLHGPISCGKSTLIDQICREFNIKLIKVNLSDIIKYQPNSKGLQIKYTQAKQQLKSNILLLFDSIEDIFPQLQDSAVNNNRENVTTLQQEFVNIIQEKHPSIFIIGITNRIKSLDSHTRNTFEEEIKMDPPNSAQRLEIFNYYLLNRNSDGSNSNSNNQKVIETINDGCSGLVIGDIAILCRDAKFNATKRLSTSTTTTKENIEFLETDFINNYGQYRTLDKNGGNGLLSKISPSTPKVSWDDIGGLEHVKKVLKEMVVWDYKHHDSIKRLGITTPKGVLLYGPPGTGKTMLAKAVAYEANATFIPINISEVVQGEVGESEKFISETFRIALACSPSIIFIDEIQSIFGHKESSGGNARKLISQLLIEMDATFSHSTDKRVMVLAATNMPQAIDESFLRPGRFDRLLYVGPPEPQERLNILNRIVSSQGIKLAPNVDLEKIAYYAARFTGSDLNALLKKSGLYAIQRDINTPHITQEDIQKVYFESKPSISDNQIAILKDWERSRSL
ncbi:hypothetical protein CYY_005114 [Polysphondylium violaceum]|uniref:AAA+ ATPase domain-containing protein n=1 Tax=Polysphondylium violaceum TaxID=133409 RepID=A0A8J4PUT0_9MYCE|nr:hypothetical protein CYY_005114 [Polysphondylium violaceum]